MSIVIKVKKLHKDAQLPIRATNGAAAFDLTVAGETQEWDDTVSYGSGLAFEFPDGVYGLLLARSSCFRKGLILANGVGLIDSDYRGEVRGVFYTKQESDYNQGDRFAQLLIQVSPEKAHRYMGAGKIVFEEVDELSDTERGTGGFGSTGL